MIYCGFSHALYPKVAKEEEIWFTDGFQFRLDRLIKSLRNNVSDIEKHMTLTKYQKVILKSEICDEIFEQKRRYSIEHYHSIQFFD